MNIRTKLIVMLAVPLVALALVAFVGFAGQNSDLELNEDATIAVQTINNLDQLWLIVADERLAVLGDGTIQEVSDLAAITDAAFDEIIESDDAAGAEVAGEAFELLPFDRQLATRSSDFAEETIAAYNGVLARIDAGIQAQPLSGLNTDAALIVNSISHAHAASQQQEDAWLELKNLSDLNTTSVRNLVSSFGSARTLRDVASTDTLTNGDRPYLAPVQSPSANQLAQIEALALAQLIQSEGGTLTDSFITDAISSLPSADLFTTLENNRAEWSAAAADARVLLEEDLAETQDDIADARSLSTFLAIIGGLLLVTLIFVIGRSIVGPLGRLVENADIMTHERLPAAVAQLRTIGASDDAIELAPIPKETNDEIGTIVDSFNEMQISALKVATDQARSRRNVAEMFVSLGRRNQQLNHRMITMISDLERDEQDPETLRGLYQLDHLATRMRRNAESLLVLAGNRSPRQWKRPVAFDDVVRSSLAEVEFFERIEIGDLPELDMSGAVVTDITHMLAELLDNATQFSDPSTVVLLSALETHTSVELQIQDQGFGINPEDLAVLNERVKNPPELDEAPSRLLGLFVVGRLAQQHNVNVDIRSVAGQGSTVTVTIPKTHFPVEVGENPIQAPSAVAPIDVNSDNAADFFGSDPVSADPVEPPIAVVDPVDTNPIDVPVEAVVEEPVAVPDPVEPPIAAEPDPGDTNLVDVPVEAVVEEPVAVPDPVEPPIAAEPDPVDVPVEAVVEEPAVAPEPTTLPDPVSVDAVDADPVPAADAGHVEIISESIVSPAATEDATATGDADVSATVGDDADPIEEPAEVPLTEDSWPITKLEPAPSREVSPMEAVQRNSETPEPEAPAPQAAPAAPPVTEQAAPPVAEQTTPEPEVLAEMPAPPVMAPPVEPSPAVAAAAATTAEPALPAPAPAPEPAPAAEVQAPSTSSFGGLPTRMPQATIETVETGPAVLPLELGEDEPSAAPDTSISFGHFAKGIVSEADDASTTEGENS